MVQSQPLFMPRSPMPDVKQPMGTSSPRCVFFPGHALLDSTASQAAWSLGMSSLGMLFLNLDSQHVTQ